MLELRTARCHRDSFAFKIFRRLDRGIGKHHDGGRGTAVNAADGLDFHALGNTVADDKAVGETDLGRLAGDQLRGAGRALSGGDGDIEPGLAIKPLLLRYDEA